MFIVSVSFQRDANRYYLDGAIRIGRNTLIILKNFNKNVITKGKEFDYRFVSRLLLQIFPKEVLRQCSASTNNMRNTAYARLDIEKYTFMEGEMLLHFSCTGSAFFLHILQNCFRFELRGTVVEKALYRL